MKLLGKLVLIVGLLLSVSAVSAQGLSCRGKTMVTFPDGAKGCIVALGESTYTSSVNVDSGLIKNTLGKWQIAAVSILMQSKFAGNRRGWASRVRHVCTSYRTQLLNSMDEGEAYRIGVIFYWPEAIAPRSAVAKPERYKEGRLSRKSAVMTTDCTSIREAD